MKLLQTAIALFTGSSDVRRVQAAEQGRPLTFKVSIQSQRNPVKGSPTTEGMSSTLQAMSFFEKQGTQYNHQDQTLYISESLFKYLLTYLRVKSAGQIFDLNDCCIYEEFRSSYWLTLGPRDFFEGVRAFMEEKKIEVEQLQALQSQAEAELHQFRSELPEIF